MSEFDDAASTVRQRNRLHSHTVCGGKGGEREKDHKNVRRQCVYAMQEEPTHRRKGGREREGGREGGEVREERATLIPPSLLAPPPLP